MSSAQTFNFSLKELYRLFHQVRHSLTREYEPIRRSYLRYAINFDDAFSFLESVNVLKANDKTIVLLIQTENIRSEDDFRSLVKDAILRLKEFPLLDDLIWNFKEYRDRYEYSPSDNQRLNTSRIRNILMEIGIVNYDSTKDCYFILSIDYLLFADHRTGQKHKVSLQMFEQIQKNRELIGLKAELAVLEYERQRLAIAPEKLDEVEHTSQEDIGAGYDILSFEDANTNRRIQIEVKAVSFADFAFNLSANEFKMAQQLDGTYFLYLVPIKDGTPDIESLLILKNPISTVFHSQNWAVENAGYMITKSDGVDQDRIL